MSPLSLGLLSLICDPLMIPTILATTRGVSELGEVSRREGAGHYADEHPRVRTEAVWAMVFALLRPGALVIVLVSVGISGWLDPDSGRHPRFGGTELEEILTALESGDPQARAIARRHLVELSPALDLPTLARLRSAPEGELTAGVLCESGYGLESGLAGGRGDADSGYVEGASLDGAYLEGAYVEGGALDDGYPEGAYLEGAYLEGAYVEGGALDDGYPEGAYLEGAYVDGEPHQVHRPERLGVDRMGPARRAALGCATRAATEPRLRSLEVQR